MVTFDATSLRSRVARRIFAVFLLCAFLPFGGLVLVSYNQVTTFFDQKNQSQLRALAKVFGMDIFERLSLLEAELQIIASSIRASKKLPSEALLDSIPNDPKEQWAAVSVVMSGGRQHRLLGRLASLPNLSAPEQKRLASGKAVLSVLSFAQGRPSRVLMHVSVDPQRLESGILTSEVNAEYLWGISHSRLLPSYVQACVQNQTGRMLMCSNSALASLPNALREKMRRSALGDFEWTHEGQDYLASYWTIPLQFKFDDPGWTVVLKTSKEAAFASIGELQRTFIFAVFASAGLSILLAIFQIRKRLVPVEKLQEGTRRIAQKDFAFQVNVRSNDEFEDLANSVNTMATQLGRQFHTLSTKAEIDRAVLSLLDTEKIVETILTRLFELFPCKMASLTLLDLDPAKPNQVFILHDKNAVPSENNGSPEPNAGNPARTDEVENSHRSRGMLRREIMKEKDFIALRVAQATIPLVLHEAEAQALDFDFIPEIKIRSILAAPLRVKDEVLGVLAFYSDQSQNFAEQEIGFLLGFTSPAAIAIYNSQLFERTKNQAVELKKANQTKDEFLSVMSHELRTPLNVILGYLHMIQEKMLGDINADQARAVGTIDRHSKNLLAMIESIMEATKIEAGAVVIESQHVDVVNLLEELECEYTVPREKELVIGWHGSRDLPLFSTDKLKLKRILQNLIANAVKFTDKGRVDISASYIAEKEAVEFTVADTGIGISEESQLTIFEMFRQLDSSKTREYGGLGLGLYIVKKLGALIGASIKVHSQPGHGAVFTVTLAVANAQPKKRVA